jgi:hypothetical protein
MTERRFNPDRDVNPWRGGSRPYDLFKEVTICFVVVAVMVIGLAVVFGSPDEKSISIQSWSNAAPVDFATTAIAELDGTSGTATYGPPYNTTPDASQKIGPISLEKIAGVHIPVNAAQDFVLGPLSTVRTPATERALVAFNAASPVQQAKWEAAYEKAVADAKVGNGVLVVPQGDYGPVGILIGSLTDMARSGALDASMLNQAHFYGTDYTKSLLFVADGSYFADLGTTHHLSGDQWGMMNETGSFPGQAWLWLYTMWYQVAPFNTSWGANADALVMALMGVLTLLLLLVPFIPGLRSIPRWTRLYKLIWRDHYKGRI